MAHRRHFLTLLAATTLTGTVLPGSFAQAAPGVEIEVLKSPGCGCCEAWADLARERGYTVSVKEFDDSAAQKAALGVPEDLTGCHTAQAGGYLFEGHVPFEAIDAVLRDKPAIAGLAVTGMPMGSPGMGNDPATRFDVIAFGGTARAGQIFYRAGTADPFAG